MGLARTPNWPGIEVWVEPIDAEHYAMFAARRWAMGPRLTAWRIVDIRAEPDLANRWRIRQAGIALLAGAEARVSPRWYKWAQQGFERWGDREDPAEYRPAQEFNAVVVVSQRPPSQVEGLARG